MVYIVYTALFTIWQLRNVQPTSQIKLFFYSSFHCYECTYTLITFAAKVNKGVGVLTDSTEIEQLKSTYFVFCLVLVH
jgi:hypothetical protein